MRPGELKGLFSKALLLNIEDKSQSQIEATVGFDHHSRKVGPTHS